jgi:hypothetical protein
METDSEPPKSPVGAAPAKALLAVLLCVALPLVTGCASLVGGRAAATLSASILNQSDPALVREAVPAYLLLLDGLIYRDPQNPRMLAAGAQLFALYGSRFAPNKARAAELTAKGRRYGEKAMCMTHEPACHWEDLDYDNYVAALQQVDRRDIDVLYAFAVSWLSNLDATSDDWSAVADLPRVEATLERLLQLDETYEHGSVHTYLGILYSLRPPALGGRPDLAKEHFERAIEISHGRDLSAKVEYARRYARLVFDRELHDRLLKEVLAASTDAPDLTLFNVLAKQEARELLASSAEYF